jgi:predicted RNase H-like nuclease
MAAYIGIDGYPGGWVAVYLEGSRQRFRYAASIETLLDRSCTRAMIDIPIGLPDHGYRDCDRAARAIVGSSVFLGARWGLWDIESYPAANSHFHANNDKGVSQQLWHLRSKLREINESMTPETQERLQETHPELVFYRLNGGPLGARKTTREGRSRRVELLKGQGLSRIEEWIGQRWGAGIRADDLIDACACVVAARDSRQRLPAGEPPVARGIRMEMWY